jgi:hypothetical protein
MILVKNTYGVSCVLAPSISNIDRINTFAGSCLDRKEKPKKLPKIRSVAEILAELSEDIKESKPVKLRSMSPRTRAKIRIKLLALTRINKNLTFLTLTFVNEVTDQVAIKILKAFLDNAKKRLTDFEYLWVAERQTNNVFFKENIHFHLITNKFWKIDKWWPYWLSIQAKFGIVPRDENFKPSSALNVKKINTDNIKQIGSYLTKYVTKNQSEFACQVWNCSKKVSRLYTSFYSGINFIRHLEKLEETGQLGGELKIYAKDFCNVCIIPLNRITINLYKKIDDKNKETWNNKILEK